MAKGANKLQQSTHLQTGELDDDYGIQQELPECIPLSRGMGTSRCNSLTLAEAGFKDDDYGDEFQVLQKMELPHDLITLQILARLPIKSLIRFKSVSKQWYSSLSSPHFAIAHFNLSPFYHPFSPTHCVFVQSGHDYFLISHSEDQEFHDNNTTHKGLLKLEFDFDEAKDKIFIVGSCNGLVCLVSLLGYLIIWNPIIHKWAKFSCPFACLEEGNNISIAWGFGYASSIDDYKIVRLVVETEQPKEIIVDVFSLKTQKWARIRDPILHGYSLGSMSRLAGVLVNETLYWIMEKVEGDYGQEILGFDLVHEKFDKIHGLVRGDSYLTWVRFLCIMGGYLSMCRFTNRGDVSISMLKEKGQVDYMGLYRDMNLSSCSSMVGFTRSGKFFVQLGDQELGLVDPKSSPKEYTKLVKFEGECKTYMTSYVPSLISPLQYCGDAKEKGN